MRQDFSRDIRSLSSIRKRYLLKEGHKRHDLKQKISASWEFKKIAFFLIYTGTVNIIYLSLFSLFLTTYFG